MAKEVVEQDQAWDAILCDLTMPDCDGPMFVAMDLASRLFSPYDLNPGGLNPLRGSPSPVGSR